MPLNLHGRSFLKLLDFTPDEIRHLLRLADSLKAAKQAGTEQPRLRGKNIALIFEKDSTRTRSGFTPRAIRFRAMSRLTATTPSAAVTASIVRFFRARNLSSSNTSEPWH